MAVLMAPTAVEWFAEASPKLQTATASARPREGTCNFSGAGDGEGDTDRAGRCEAIVEVWGMMLRS